MSYALGVGGNVIDHEPSLPVVRPKRAEKIPVGNFSMYVYLPD